MRTQSEELKKIIDSIRTEAGRELSNRFKAARKDYVDALNAIVPNCLENSGVFMTLDGGLMPTHCLLLHIEKKLVQEYTKGKGDTAVHKIIDELIRNQGLVYD